MNHQTKTRLVETFIVAILSLIALYFSLHVVVGDRGWLVLVKNRTEYEQAARTLQRLTAKRDAINQQIEGLREESIDLDLLEEKARFMLGYTNPEEKIILDPYRHSQD